jgi:hypothetical protein
MADTPTSSILRAPAPPRLTTYVGNLGHHFRSQYALLGIPLLITPHGGHPLTLPELLPPRELTPAAITQALTADKPPVARVLLLATLVDQHSRVAVSQGHWAVSLRRAELAAALDQWTAAWAIITADVDPRAKAVAAVNAFAQRASDVAAGIPYTSVLHKTAPRRRRDDMADLD